MAKKQVQTSTVRWFKDISYTDVTLVGGKNASLGEMYTALKKKGVEVPNGFAVTVDAYWSFFKETGLDTTIKELLKGLDVHTVQELRKTGKKIRTAILKETLPAHVQKDIVSAYKKLSKGKKISVAVRSSATAEDLPGASFAGQQETYLNVQGEKELLLAVKKCIASLFTDRAISYREIRGFDHRSVALSVTVQEMVRSDVGTSGVLFTLDTESGFDGVVLINAAYGLGEYVVKGRVTPDQFYVFKEGVKQGKSAIISRTLGTKDVKLQYGKKNGTKQEKVSQKDRNRFCLSDEDVIQLTKWGLIIEEHYGKPQDIEWAKDGKTGQLYIVQARPETVQSEKKTLTIEKYSLNKEGKILARGAAVGQKIGAGKVRIVEKPSQMKEFKDGEILVTRITDPDWEPIMKKAAAIVTEQGGKTSHAAIVSRELGVPCIVGVEKARKVLKNGQKVTVSCAKGDEGLIFEGILPFEVSHTQITDIPKTKTKILMNVGDPDHAFSLAALPTDGVGLARLEFIFSNFIRIHPLALVHYNKLKNKTDKQQIAKMTRGYKKKTEYCVDKLAEGIGRIAAASYPNKVIVRMSDFKTNEYATLIGGAQFEPKEENPMIGWRGASRYYSKEYKEGFRLECEAMKRAREDWGLTNIVPMIPFCRTPEEGKQVLDTMKEFGLERGKNGLEVYVMCEIPSNVILADEFAKLFDGFSIGSNDLTQLTLGLDRDTSSIMDIGDARHAAVKKMISDVIRVAHKHKRKIGLCGQAPSDDPTFADFLVKEGIDSISLNPDSVIDVRKRVAMIEKKRGGSGKRGKRKSHAFMSIFLAFAALSAGIMSLGAGCVGPGSEYRVNQGSEAYVSPAEIREKVEKQYEERLQKLEEKMEQMNQPKGTPHVIISFPDDWNVDTTKIGDGFSYTNNASVAYEYIEYSYGEESYNTNRGIEGISDEQIDPVSTTVSGLVGNLYEVPALPNGVQRYIWEYQYDGGYLFIEGSKEGFLDMLSRAYIAFVPDDTDTPESGELCAQVITFAQENLQSQCQPFPTPCDVPDGWKQCNP